MKKIILAIVAIMRQKTRVDDEALKILGVGWLKRKALKASLALMPESQKAKYEVKGNKVIVIDDKDRDVSFLAIPDFEVITLADKKRSPAL